MKEKILLVEDDLDVLEILTLYLCKSEYQVVSATSGNQAQKLFDTEFPELILCDIQLPDVDGREWIRAIRSISSIPVILISCKKDGDDIVSGLYMGADDYITKPFEPNVVVARVSAQLRRYKEISPQETRNTKQLTDGGLVIDSSACEVWLNGQQVKLFAKEFKLLQYLSNHPGQVLTLEQIYENVWGWDNNSDIRTVMVHIRNLRKKIEPDPANPCYIKTVRGFGYKFSSEPCKIDKSL